MKKTSYLSQFMSCENGATAIEYALIATGVSLAIAVSVYAFGDTISDLFDGLTGLLAG